MCDLSNKVIVVTGASSGIGRSCAIELAAQGATIALVGRDGNKLNATLSSMQGAGHLVVCQDVTEYQSLEGRINTIVETLGPIGGFIHSAGIEMTVPFRMMRPKHYEQLFATNVIAGFEIARILAKDNNFAPAGASFIIISSILGLVGKPGAVGYCASKSAIMAGVKAMSLEIAYKKIRVNAILPGVVETELIHELFETIPQDSVTDIIKKHPLGLGQPDDVANLCAFLLSDKSRWITGTSQVIDGGYSAQ